MFHNYAKEAVYVLLRVILILGIYFLVEIFVIEPVKIVGNSMNPTLEDGEIVLVEKISYRFDDIKRYDMIVFEEDKNYVKRVIGLPGEVVHIIDGTIYVNNEPLEEYYAKEEMAERLDTNEPVTVGENELFVLGDNRNNSMDSRSSEIGLVSSDAVLGRVSFRVYPLDGFGSLTNQ